MSWEDRWAKREANRPGNRLREKLKELFRIGDDDANEIVSLLGELIDEKTSDLEDKINQTGEWSPDY